MIRFKQIRENKSIEYDKLDYLPHIGECVNLCNEYSKVIGVVIKITHEIIYNDDDIIIEVY